MKNKWSIRETCKNSMHKFQNCKQNLKNFTLPIRITHPKNRQKHKVLSSSRLLLPQIDRLNKPIQTPKKYFDFYCYKHPQYSSISNNQTIDFSKLLLKIIIHSHASTPQKQTHSLVITHPKSAKLRDTYHFFRTYAQQLPLVSLTE